ncbi:hypothetical protein HYV31_04265 [candidate division WWE3 bacterium]|nr:hypothetical protein [candidate division WWE3 bacterium]
MKISPYVQVIGSREFHQVIRDKISQHRGLDFLVPFDVHTSLESFETAAWWRTSILVIEEAAGHMDEAYPKQVESFVHKVRCLHNRIILKGGVTVHILSAKCRFFNFWGLVFRLASSDDFLYSQSY